MSLCCRGEHHLLVECKHYLAVGRNAGTIVFRNGIDKHRSLAIVDNLGLAHDECSAKSDTVIGRRSAINA